MVPLILSQEKQGARQVTPSTPEAEARGQLSLEELRSSLYTARTLGGLAGDILQSEVGNRGVS